MVTGIKTQQVLADFRKFANSNGMDEILVEIKCWDGSSEQVNVTMYSKEKINNGSKYSISASISSEIYNVESLELKLQADLIEQKLSKK